MKRLLAACILVSACAQTQQPYRFSLSMAGAGAPVPIDDVVRALAQSGQTAQAVDERAGVIHTQWQDTGFMYGDVQGSTATIVRRYIVTLSPASGGTDIQIRIDAQRCGQGNFTIGDRGIRGTCEHMDVVVGKHQEELNALGAQVKDALAAAK